MKLLLDGRQAENQSGTGRYTVELARQFVARSDVRLRAVWPENALERDSWLPHESAIPCGVRRNPVGTIRRIRQIAREVKSFGPNIIHFPANIGPYWKFRREPLSKVVVTLHDVSFFREPAWFDYRRALFYRHAAARGVAVADRVVTDSSCSADDIMHYLKVPSSRLSVVPLGVGETFRPTSPEEQSRTLDKLKLPRCFFLYYGTLEPRKNIERIVRAWSGIADRCEEDLVIAGRPGWKTGGIERAIRESGFGNRIHICGFVESGDLPALIGAARALVWTSLGR